MGAHNIEFTMPGTPSFIAIQKKFKEQQQDDHGYNGHREGYSGDFQTVREVKDHTNQTFDSYNQAHDYCMDKAEKWVSVVAVRYRFLEKFEPTKKLQDMKTKLDGLVFKLTDLNKIATVLPKFVSCECCSSKINSEHLSKGHYITCPICRKGDFRPMSIQRSETSLKLKITEVRAAYEGQLKIEKAKALKKSGKVGTLVAGWGAS